MHKNARARKVSYGIKHSILIFFGLTETEKEEEIKKQSTEIVS